MRSGCGVLLPRAGEEPAPESTRHGAKRRTRIIGAGRLLMVPSLRPSLASGGFLYASPASGRGGTVDKPPHLAGTLGSVNTLRVTTTTTITTTTSVERVPARD